LLWSEDATNHIISLYSCDNFTLKMAAIATETCWWENCNENTSLTTKCIFFVYLYIVEMKKMFYCSQHQKHSYSKTSQMHQFLKFILFWNNTLHVSDGLSVHHQEFKAVHTATGICQTDTVVCLLASRQQYLFDIYLLLYVQP